MAGVADVDPARDAVGGPRVTLRVPVSHGAALDRLAGLSVAVVRACGEVARAHVFAELAAVAFVRDDPGASGGTDDAGPYGWIFTFERFDQGWQVSDVEPTDRTVELFTAAGYAPDTDR